MSSRGCMRLTGGSTRTFLSCRVRASTPCSVVSNRFVNKVRANLPQGTQTYSDHEKAMKLLYALDRKVWEVKVQTIIESAGYETLTVDELFIKLKALEVEKLSRAKMEGNHADASASKSMALVGTSGANSDPSLGGFCLSSLVSVTDEQLEVLGNEELALIIHKF